MQFKSEAQRRYFEANKANLENQSVDDADLQRIEPDPIQALDAIGSEQVAIGDESRHAAVAAYAADQVVQVRVHQRLAPAERDNGRTQLVQQVDAAKHDLGRHRL